MAVKIRLTRLGKKKQPTYRVVVMDSRKPRDGKYIEQLGIYDPKQEPSVVQIDNDRALYWLNTGAQPTERAQKLLEISGAWTQFRVARGDIHTISGEDETTEAASKPDSVDEPVEEPAAHNIQDTAEADTEDAVQTQEAPEAEDASQAEETAEVAAASDEADATQEASTTAKAAESSDKS